MIRADIYISKFGYAKSRESAKKLIEKGSVKIDGREIKKPSETIDENSAHIVEVIKEKYVSRGSLKLEGALDAFEIDVCGKVCIDIGASTGGFSDCLLQRGAEKIFAVDSGHGQLDITLRENPKIVNIEGYNARDLDPCDFPYLFDIAVMDVSFISQTYILGGASRVLSESGILVSLIKPQFEAGRSAVGKGGIVKKKEDRENAVTRVIDSAKESGLYCKGLIISPIKGGDGNIEYLGFFTKNEKDFNVDRKYIK
ncbi:MAG: TlyA family RNA methyltransferase, partial [Clostridia bacterium]|nr:TlyA family RNA methyltransferase [Clostridia bacterium]